MSSTLASFVLVRGNMHRLWVLFVCFLLSSCAYLDHRDSNYYANHQAGINAINCGEVHDGESTEKIDSCVIRNLTDRKSFYAWYWLFPVDSFPAYGLQYTEENRLYISWYEEGYWIFAPDFQPKECESWSLDFMSDKSIILCEMDQAESASIYGIEHIVKFVQKANKSSHSHP